MNRMGVAEVDPAPCVELNVWPQREHLDGVPDYILRVKRRAVRTPHIDDGVSGRIYVRCQGCSVTVGVNRPWTPSMSRGFFGKSGRILQANTMVMVHLDDHHAHDVLIDLLSKCAPGEPSARGCRVPRGTRGGRIAIQGHEHLKSR